MGFLGEKAMALVIGRKNGESFYIGDDIKITIVIEKRNRARIVIQAPKDKLILRSELIDEEKNSLQKVE